MKISYLMPLIILLSGCSIYFEPDFNLSEEVRIYQVIDGDTFIVSGGEYVRLLGVDAPERKQEGYHEATDFLRQFEGQAVTLEAEGADRDKFGRLLRHAYVNNKSLAVALLENKHAVIYDEYQGTYREELNKLR